MVWTILFKDFIKPKTILNALKINYQKIKKIFYQIWAQ